MFLFFTAATMKMPLYKQSQNKNSGMIKRFQ